MHYVYIIKSKVCDELYTGFSSDLKERMKNHNEGKSYYTKRYVPWRLVYYEAYSSKKDAMERERKLKKHANGYAQLKNRIKNSLLDKKPKGVG